ncbi:N(4)-(Beta-N-acetylglucosaminyl)-L-asparaginase-like [Oopsacas minuta]|uniref:N(4)-(Beta-N-acetylglucosaminyl)-L-asparaginase-like n=1 Tax=Oopsacas minuta TaxID=111878 RepID=A0AAV7JN00_9METZ|nr:N(4)-(Beta-N-acetylglucosaminyl)-L-asparaginase-like [Oopsacas minuta]
MACIATWPFGYQAVSAAIVVIEKGGSSIEALKAGITIVENDASLGPRYVGRGNFPNASGFPQYDGAVMRGSDCKIGAVGALEHCPNALSVACSVLEKSKHSFLVGAGATAFAQTQGFLMEPHEDLLKSGPKVDQIVNFPTEPSLPIAPPSHDTISMIVLDQQGDLACGVSTSGILGKEVGRVGDCPLSGNGFYADNKYGACCATGNGDIIMQYCPCFHVIMLMRYQGLSPQLACEEVVKDMVNRNNSTFMVALIAMDPKGIMGASGTINTTDRGIKKFDGFPAALWDIGSKNLRMETYPNILKQCQPN